ncbi:hypothetical protein JCGZ_16401 [Jatropha curcas]|uniref:Uncharacterized protein n=1 Tax=Jatropha curcas TaxID=180498 RepID=A0A067K6T7_JATCU|nr:hypothetical protein JCGZ_16401 [Jatropha curcas]
MSLYIQEQVTQELHDLAFNKCYEELEGTPKFLTLMKAHVELELELPTYSMPKPCYVTTPVQGGTHQAVPSSDLLRKTTTLKHPPCQIAHPGRASL